MKTTIIALATLCCATAGCEALKGATGNIDAADPTERGLSYLALAIIVSAIIRAIFNK